MKSPSTRLGRAMVLLGLAVISIGAARAALPVYVGYADGLRGSGFFPNPWNGDPGVVFLGTTPAYDAGAIRVDNTSGVPQNITIAFSASWDHSFDKTWSSLVGAGQKLIVTETAHYNFDTSDLTPFAGASLATPLPTGSMTGAGRVDVTVGSTLFTYYDTGHILNTGGFDLAGYGLNESQQWRPIGTTGIEDPGGTHAGVPDGGSTFALVIGSILGLACLRRFRRNPAC